MINSQWEKIALTGFIGDVPGALGLCKNGYFLDVSKLCSKLLTMLKNGSRMTPKSLKIVYFLIVSFKNDALPGLIMIFRGCMGL